MNTLTELLKNTLRNNFSQPALSNYRQDVYTYKQVFQHILAIHDYFEEQGISLGDKVALYSRNDANWAIVYLATISYGAVIVPILADFHASDVEHIIQHSDSKLLFASDSMLAKLNVQDLDQLVDIISIHTFTSLKQENFNRQIRVQETAVSLDDIAFKEIPSDQIAVISYTSGTSGNSKGVMLSHKNIWSNARFGWDAPLDLAKGDTIVSFLPLAHAYGCLFEFIAPFMMGCHIVFLTKIPSPQIVMQAFGELKPKLVLAVPLVIEKIYKKKIQPILNKPIINVALKVPLLSAIIERKICKQLAQAFGGRFVEVIIGGAAFNPEIERFFMRIGFRLTIGYGMTECGPLISYSGWKNHKLESAGYVVNRMHCRINSVDPQSIPGEIEVKGDNVMLGYYKNETATVETFTEDGWLKTGDLGIIDPDGYIFIKGRSKSMILSSNGQNIYPEEIENVINQHALVAESLVRDNNGKLEALVFPDFENTALSTIEVENQILSFRNQWNKKLSGYSQISKVKIVNEEFEKTPKKSIKRYLYNIQ